MSERPRRPSRNSGRNIGYNVSVVPRLFRRSAGFTLVELMVVVAILGILAAIAIPTVALYIRRAKTSEPRIQLAKMFDASVAYFLEEHVQRGSTESLGAGAGLAAGGAHLCPHPDGSPSGGAAGLTPGIDCNLGPGGHCVPGVGATGAGYYDMTRWTDNQVWNDLSFLMEQQHFYNYNYTSSNSNTGYGKCQFTSQAFGNLDADTIYSTFERSGGADQNGVNGAAGLYINLVVE